MSLPDLERSLERCRLLAEQVGFATIAHTARTITLSPKHRSALKGAGNLIFDLSVMATDHVRVGPVEARQRIREAYCLVVTLNNERESAVLLYGVVTGLGLYRRFGEFMCNALDDKLALDRALQRELVSTVAEGVRWLLIKASLAEQQAVARWLGRDLQAVVKAYDTGTEDCGAAAGSQAFAE